MALLVTLGIVAVLLVLASSFAIAVRTETHLVGTSLQRTQCNWLAEAGLQRAMIELRNNPSRFTALSSQAQDGQPMVLYFDSNDDQGLALKNGSFTVAAFDEAARLNLNSLDEATLRQYLAGEDALVDALLHWREQNPATRDNTPNDDYYTAQDMPYNPRHDWFQTLGEMMLVKEVTPARYYDQEDISPLANPDEIGQADPNVPSLASSFTVDSYDDNTTLDDTSRTNVQTASRDDLEQTFGDDLTSQDLDRLIQYRDGTGQGSAGGQAGGAAQGLATGGGAANAPAGTTTGGTAARTNAKKPGSVAELVDVLGRDKLQTVYDRLTVTDDPRELGLINVNTASAQVLAALPGMDSTLAQTIIQARQEQPFETVGDLLRLSDVTNALFKQIAPLLTTRSRAYRLKAAGSVGDGEATFTRTIEAVVLVEATNQPATTGATSADNTPQRRLRMIYRRME